MLLDYRTEQDRVCCEGCTLHPKVTGMLTWYVPTEIEGQPDIFFVLEAPGDDEDRYQNPNGIQGRPAVGVSGQILRACMQEAGIHSEYAIANVCKCRPIRNQTPNEDQINHCRPYLLEEIQRHKPKVIVLCGGLPIRSLCPELLNNGGVLRAQGRYLEKDGITYIANVHPSYIARQYEEKSKQTQITRFTNVLKTAKKIIDSDPTVDWLKPGYYYYADTVDKVKSIVDSYLKNPSVEGILAFDTETMEGLNRFKNRVSILQFCNDGQLTTLIPFDHPESPWDSDEKEIIKNEIIRLFVTPTDAFQWIVGNNLKFDLAMLRTCIHPDLGTARLPVQASLLDTMYLAHSIDEQRLKRIPRNEGPMKLSTLARDFIGWTRFEDNGLKNKRDQFDKISLKDEKFREYCAMDGYVPHRLSRQMLLLADMEEGGRDRVLNFNVHMHGPLIQTFESIERNGFQIDVPHLRVLCGELSPIKRRIADILDELKSFPEVKKANKVHMKKTKAGGMVALFQEPWVLDIDKKDCLITLFIDVLGLEPVSYNKEKFLPDGTVYKPPQIDTKFFERYRSKDGLLEEGEEVDTVQHIIDLVYEYKGLYKLDTSYTKSVDKRINGEGPNGECADGRMRSSFTSCRVTSGRTSSEKVNLQQVPGSKGRLQATNAARKAVKNMYCVPEGRLLVQMDVAQSEIRWAVQIALDKNYAKVFQNMEKIKAEYIANPTEENKKRVKFECDVHRQTAALMHQIPIEEVTDIQRQGAKSLVFGMLFGQHVTTLAKNLGIEVEVAEGLLETFFKQFPDVERWLINAEKEAQTKGYVTSPMGRRRHLAHEYAAGNDGRGNRQARNSPIQAASSDYNLIAGIRLQNYIERHNKDWKIVNLVHDSIITEISYYKDDLLEYIEIAERIFMDTSCLKEMFGIEMIVPLAVDFDIGFKYGDCKGFDRSDKNFEEIWSWLEDQVAEGSAWPKATTHVWH